MIDLLDGSGLKLAGGPIAQAAFVGTAMVDGGVFPEGTDFVNDGDAKFAGDLDCRQGIEHRGMGVNDVRANFACNFFQPGFQLLHQGQFLAQGDSGQGSLGYWRAIEAQTIDVIEGSGGLALLW